MAKGMELSIEVWDLIRSEVSDSFKTNIKAEGVENDDDMRIFFLALCSKCQQMGYTEEQLITGVQYTFRQMDTIPIGEDNEIIPTRE